MALGERGSPELCSSPHDRSSGMPQRQRAAEFGDGLGLPE
jgi:hypothetical protein